ncbi:hypothetical protein [Solirhodobacter olei]|uniref:hypothetical protein n=1 Tax=Solirhodobacter olei TaxID=2493082 RepID=UPI000FD8594E|nr:hypothetical protein [Solirhodobacter olei]
MAGIYAAEVVRQGLPATLALLQSKPEAKIEIVLSYDPGRPTLPSPKSTPLDRGSRRTLTGRQLPSRQDTCGVASTQLQFHSN